MVSCWYIDIDTAQEVLQMQRDRWQKCNTHMLTKCSRIDKDRDKRDNVRWQCSNDCLRGASIQSHITRLTLRSNHLQA